MVNKHVKRYPTLLVIRETQTDLKMRYHPYIQQWLETKTQIKPSVGDNGATGGKQDGTVTLGTSLMDFIKTEIYTFHTTEWFQSLVVTQGKGNYMFVHKYVCNFHSSIIQHSQTSEATQMSLNWWTNTGNTTETPKWNKLPVPVVTQVTLKAFLWMKEAKLKGRKAVWFSHTTSQKRQNSRDKNRSVVATARGLGEGWPQRAWGQFLGDRMFHISVVVVVTALCSFFQDL